MPIMSATRETSSPISRDNTKRTGWLAELESQWTSGKRCFGLTFNVHDYVMAPDQLPRPFVAFLCERFSLRGHLVVTFSISGGLKLHQQNEEKERTFQRYSGLTLEDQALTHSGVLKGLGRLLSQNVVPAVVILDYAQHLVPSLQAGMGSAASDDQISCAEILHDWSLDNYLNNKTENGVVAILREGHYNELLSDYWRIIRVGLPTQDEHESFYRLLSNLGEAGKPFAGLDVGVSVESAAQASRGLRLRTVEELSRRAESEKRSITLIDIKEESAIEIRRLCGDVLEVMDTGGGFEKLHGIQHVKRFCLKIKTRLLAGKRNVPLGLLFVGPPGCGKSRVVRAFAGELQWNCLSMRAVRSPWVGESERNLERVLNAIDSHLPAILFIDEVDQALGQRGVGGDGGTSERMLARLWEFMAQNERRGRLIFCAATNRPELLDSATLDRFQYVIPVLHPTATEFEEILPACAAELDCEIRDPDAVTGVARTLEESSISIRQAIDIVAMASLKSDGPETGDRTMITKEHLTETVANFRSNHDRLEMEAITLEAIRMTTFSELLPWHDRSNNHRYPAFLSSVMDEHQRISPAALAKRIAFLRNQRLSGGRE